MSFVGLDFETSGTRHDRHVPIQLGLAAPDGYVYTSLIGGWHWEGGIDSPSFEWNEDSAKVHGISRDDLNLAPAAVTVDAIAAEWIGRHYAGTHRNRIHAVGWNVAAFDFPFMRRHLPALTATMSYRSVDLNAVVFTMTQARLQDARGDVWGYERLKRHVKDRAAERVREETGQGPKWHDAGYDALTALYAFEELQQQMKGPA